MIALPNVYTLPAGMPFAHVLAAGLWAEYAHDLLALSDVQIYLPNRRSCRALADAFLEISDGRATLLPQLTPLGDIDEEDLIDTDPFIIDDDPYLTPAIDPMARSFTLAQLLLARGDIRSFSEAYRLACDLGRFIDQAHTESVDLNKIGTLVTGDLARHWQITQEFLAIITDVWPAYLKEKNLCDPAQRRNTLIEKKIKALLATQPKHRIIAAGSTGSIPIVRKLLSVIARLPNGSLILPGFNPQMDKKTWDAIDAPHPNYYIKKLIEELAIEPVAISFWPQIQGNAVSSPRQSLIDQALQPASIFDLTHAKTSSDVIKDVDFIAADHALHEARIIALKLRDIIKNPNETAMVVTTDRTLAQRIQAEMTRWDIQINDSAGQSLDQKPVGIFLRQIAEFSNTQTPMTSALGILLHPFCTMDLEENNFRTGVHETAAQFHNSLLPPGGLADFARDNEFLTTFLGVLNPFLTPQKFSLTEWIERLVSTAEKLSSASILWRGEDGEAAAQLLHTILHQEKAKELTLDAYDFAQFLFQILQQQVIRPRFGLHPRLRILSPIEARLQHADHIILGGLNEGTWPAQPKANTWLSRPMMHEMGFGEAERRIGQSALDFANLFCAQNVTITWAAQREGAPAHPARWLQQILAVLEKNGHTILPEASDLYQWAKIWDRPDHITPRQAPFHTSDYHPPALRVTDVELWQKDAYAFYVKNILCLKPGDPLDRVPDARDWGNVAHAVLEEFSDNHNFQKSVDLVLARYALNPSLETQWRHKLALIGDWLNAQQTLGPHEVEFKLSAKIAYSDKNSITLNGRADRIDKTRDGLVINDYKTGKPPSNIKVEKGLSPQLPLLGMMAKHQFDGKDISGLHYIHLAGKKSSPVDIKPLKNPGSLIEKNEDHLKNLLKKYYNDNEAYRASVLSVYDRDDYAQIKRVAEWAASDGTSDEDAG